MVTSGCPAVEVAGQAGAEGPTATIAPRSGLAAVRASTMAPYTLATWGWSTMSLTVAAGRSAVSTGRTRTIAYLLVRPAARSHDWNR
jgi:hypothetical protein